MSGHPNYFDRDEETVPLKDFVDDEVDSTQMAYASSTSSSIGIDAGTQSFSQMKHSRRKQEEDAAEALSMRLLAIEDDDSDEEDRVLRESFSLLGQVGLEDEADDDAEYLNQLRIQSTRGTLKRNTSVAFRNMMDYVDEAVEEKQLEAQQKVCTMVALAIAAIITVVVGFYVTVQFIGPPSQPVGQYSLIERQEGESFFDYYSFYEGPDCKYKKILKQIILIRN